MRIKNNGQKIVHVGSVMILPEQIQEVPGGITPPLAALIERGVLSVAGAEQPAAAELSAESKADKPARSRKPAEGD